MNVFYSLCKNTQKKANLPEIKKIIENNSKNMGKLGFKLWDNQHDPYAEKGKFDVIYNNIIKHIEPFKLETNMIPAVFGFVLNEISGKVSGIFPKKLNCYEMTVETIVFYAHLQ